MSTVYNPQPISQDSIKRDVEREHQSIKRALDGVILSMARTVSYSEPEGSDRPDNPQFGYFAYADGVSWNPAGDGIPGFFIKGNTGWLRIAVDQ